jgi:hypothetical protein
VARAASRWTDGWPRGAIDADEVVDERDLDLTFRTVRGLFATKLSETCMVQHASDSAEDVARRSSLTHQQGARASSFVRWVIYSHVFAVMICALFSHMDHIRAIDKLPEAVIAIPLLPSLLGLFVCPAIILGMMISGRLRGRDAVMVFVAEIALECAQFFVLLPAVS